MSDSEKPKPKNLFQKGNNANPKGRPKLSEMELDIRKLAKTHSEAAFMKLVSWSQSANHKASIPACNAILDRAYGKPAQAIENASDVPFAIEVSWKK